MRSDRAYVKRRHARCERRNIRAKRRSREHNVWPPNDERTDSTTRLGRMFRGIHPMTPFQRMTWMERAQVVKMKEVYG